MERAAPGQVVDALTRSAVWPVDLAPGAGFVPLADLVAGGLAERICTRLGEPPRRVGESAVVMGVASRLWSVTVVSAARDGVLVDVEALVGDDDEGALVLGLAQPRGFLDPTVEEVDAAIQRVLQPLVESFDLSPHLLWGNVAASLHAVPRVHDLPAAEPLVADLLTRAPYAGQLDASLAGPVAGRARRRTCCLFYLVPGAGVCGDCVFDVAPRR
jgi:hypothetical protein